VIWEIDLATASPKEAALEALRIQRDSNSIATVFDVSDADGNIERIDLGEGDDNELVASKL
jgi:hypothetical protein